MGVVSFSLNILRFLSVHVGGFAPSTIVGIKLDRAAPNPPQRATRLAMPPDTCTSWTPDLRRWLDHAAREAGFDAAGIAGVPGPNEPASAGESQRFTAWDRRGRAGEMNYLKRRDEAGTLVRSALRVPMPGPAP